MELFQKLPIFLADFCLNLRGFQNSFNGKITGLNSNIYHFRLTSLLHRDSTLIKAFFPFKQKYCFQLSHFKQWYTTKVFHFLFLHLINIYWLAFVCVFWCFAFRVCVYFSFPLNITAMCNNVLLSQLSPREVISFQPSQLYILPQYSSNTSLKPWRHVQVKMSHI